MEVKEIAIEEIKAYGNNPRKNDQAVDAVANSIKEFGWKQPLVIDPKTMEIVVGHTRWKAAKKLGMKTVPCIMADDLTEEQIKAYRLADNKTNELAEWDFDLLGEELDGILDLDMTDFGFDFSEQEAEKEVTEDIPPEVDEENEPTCKLGDIWQLGEHRLMCGDSTDRASVEKLMNGEVADLIVTDPPYNVNYEGQTEEKLKIANDHMCANEFEEFLTAAFANMFEYLKQGGGYYVWHASRTQREFEEALMKNEIMVREQIIWAKNAFTLGRQDYQWKHEPCFYGWKDGATHYFIDDRTQTTVIEEDKPVRNAEHPTMKPVKLLARLIKNSSRLDEAVLDLFGGSGSTLIACEQMGRKCYMMEIDPKYCDVIVKRWENLTGRKAVRMNAT